MLLLLSLPLHTLPVQTTLVAVYLGQPTITGSPLALIPQKVYRPSQYL